MSVFRKKRKYNRAKSRAELIYILFGASILLSMVITIYVMNHTSRVQDSFDDILKAEAVEPEDKTVTDEKNAGPVQGEEKDASVTAADRDVLMADGASNTETDADAPEEISILKPAANSTYAAPYHAEGKLEGTNGKTVYLTFDDGPSSCTSRILDILAERNVKATFFVVNTNEFFYDDMKRIVDEGHTIAMHSYTHDYGKVYADLNSFERDVNKIHDLIYDVTGVDTKYYRFPGGSSNQVSKVPMSECIDYLDDMGYVYFDWNAMNDDAEVSNLSADELNSRALGYIRSNPGDSVLLLHDLETHQGTVDALPGLLDTLIAEGYSIAAIDDDTPIVHHFEAE